MRRFFYIFAALVAAVVGLNSCIDDSFTTDPNDLLTFSVDTVKFDTVMTMKGTTTKQFIIYNRSKKQINISSIQVAGVSKAHFYLNVDGTKGKVFRDIEIRGGDSIYVFVEGYVDKVGKNEPEEYNDRIDFVTNGVTQSVALNAWGQDVRTLIGTVFETDTRLTNETPYIIYDSLVVKPNVTLTIDPGTTLLFHDKALLEVYGTLQAIGTKDKPIVMRGDRLDHVVGDIDFDIMAGQWGGVLFFDGSYGNELHYVDIHSTQYGVQIASSNPAKKALHLFNSVMHNSESYTLLTINAWVEAEGTEFSDAPEGVVAFLGGKVRATQCTFANYYLFASIEGPNIAFFENDDEQSLSPLDCKLVNCISYGLGYDVNMGDMSGTNIWIYNTLFKSSGNDDDHFFGLSAAKKYGGI
ncbi:MAG: hypothetical protein Q4B68_03805, partial [Bacteroidales bacterium]|nr:hypothetical protein [Bacteroidales bacterium]